MRRRFPLPDIFDSQHLEMARGACRDVTGLRRRNVTLCRKKFHKTSIPNNGFANQVANDRGYMPSNPAAIVHE